MLFLHFNTLICCFFFICNRFQTHLLVLFASFTALINGQPQGFAISPSTHITKENTQQVVNQEDDLTSAAANYRPQQSYSINDDEDDDEDDETPVSIRPTHPQSINRRQQQQQQFVRKGQTNKEILDELEEQEEPDRLTQLLEHSKFKCEGRTG